jgi:hypothetical protein
MKTLCALAAVFMLAPPADIPLKTGVYVHESDTALRRVTTFHYQAHPGFDILYCVAEEPNSAVIQCVVRTPMDRLELVEKRAGEFRL